MNEKYKYRKTKWVDGKTCVNAEELNRIEDGIEDLYLNAIDSEQILPGDGITVDLDDDGNTVISVKDDYKDELVKSQSISGLEYVNTTPLDPSPDVLYFVVNPDTGTLEKIMLNGVTIFNIS
jgi:hypothetical protein